MTPLIAAERYWSLVYDAFTSMLPWVEEVHLTALLHLGSTMLSIFRSDGESENTELGMVQPIHTLVAGRQTKAKIVEALDAAFAEFIKKP